MTKANLKKRAQPFFDAGVRSQPRHIQKPSQLEPYQPHTQQIAMQELRISMSKVFPLFNLQPSSAQVQTTDEGHLNTLHRIARHLRERAHQYAEIYLHFKVTIGTNANTKIAEHSKTFEEALEAVTTLPTKPKDPEVVHDVLRKVSAAAHALVFLQRDEITARDERISQLERELATLKNPGRAKDVVERLHRLWHTNQLKYEKKRGKNASVAQWIEDNLVKLGHFTDEEINLIPTATYRHVDKHLYQALMDARRNGRRTSTSRINVETAAEKFAPQRLERPL
jgi:hypothetical protein